MPSTITERPIDRPFTLRQVFSHMSLSCKNCLTEVAIRTGLLSDGRFIVLSKRLFAPPEIPLGHNTPSEEQYRWWLDKIRSYFQPIGDPTPLHCSGSEPTWQGSDGKRPIRRLFFSSVEGEEISLNNRYVLTAQKLAGVRPEKTTFKICTTAAPWDVVGLFDEYSRQFAVIATMETNQPTNQLTNRKTNQ